MPLFRLNTVLWIFAFLAISGLAGLYVGQDANWDLRNYHLYNPFAFLNGRYAIDIAPAQRQTFHNPLADLPFFWLVENFNEAPRFISFVMSLPYGAAAALIAWLARSTLAQHRRRPVGMVRFIEAGCAVALGVTGAATVAVIGSTMNEIQISLFFLLALSLAVRRLGSGRRDCWLLLAVGLLAGVGAGLKISYVLYGVTLGGALVVMAGMRRLAIREIFAYSGGALAGFAAAHGYWSTYLYARYSNPVFPYFNNLFRSEYALIDDYKDRRFLPDSFGDGLLYPFYWAAEPARVGSEKIFRDPRLSVALVFVLISLAYILWCLFRSNQGSPQKSKGNPEKTSLVFLSVFFVASLYGMIFFTGIHRYFVLLEMLSGIVIVGVLSRVPAGRFRALIVVGLAASIVALTIPQQWGRIRFADRFIDIDMPALPKGSVVLLWGGGPMGYLATAVGPSVRVIGINNNFQALWRRTRYVDEVRALIANGKTPLFVVFNPERTDVQLAFRAANLRIRHEDCETIAANIDPTRPVICPAERAKK